jgi:hypothetical protein
MSSSKMVNDRYRSALLVAKIAEVNADAIGPRLDAAFAAEDDTDPPTDWGRIMRLVGRSIVAQAQRLIEADKALIAELSDDQDPRDRRDSRKLSISQRLGAIRGIVRSIYGETAAARVGLSGTLPTEPIALHRTATLVHDNLPLLAALAPVIQGGSMDIGIVRTELAEEIAALGTAIDDLARESRERETAQVLKDRAMDAYDATFSFGARMIEGLLGAAGELELAARVRPSIRQPGRVEGPIDGTEPGELPPEDGGELPGTDPDKDPTTSV